MSGIGSPKFSHSGVRVTLSVVALLLSLVIFISLLSCSGDDDGPTQSPPVPLEVVSIAPDNQATGIDLDAHITIVFNRAVDPATLSSTTCRIGGISCTMTSSSDTVTLSPAAPLAFGTRYTVTVSADVADMAGVSLESAYVAQFTTVASAGTPTANAGVDVDSDRGEPVTLIGSASSDPNGLALTHMWTQISGPIVSFVPTDVDASFTAPDAVSTMEFVLVVSSASGTSVPDTVLVSVFENKDLAVFVSPLGDDDNPGTRLEPMLTLDHAITAASYMIVGFDSVADVYVANGEYLENVNGRRDVSLYGGYDPDRWTRDFTTYETVIRGVNPGGHLEGNVVVWFHRLDSIIIEGFRIQAADGVAASRNYLDQYYYSSVAISLWECNGITITGNQIVAGHGADGIEGSAPFRWPQAPWGDNGETGVGILGGEGGAQPGISNAGGDGGGAVYLIDAYAGENGEGPGGGGGTAGAILGDRNGGQGWYGHLGSSGSNGVGGDSLGTVIGGFFAVSSGQDGTPGTSGGGGGGGGGGTTGWPLVGAGSGGGGGCGGRGGDPSTGGTGGGASIGILIYSSHSVRLIGNSITCGNGGNGGLAHPGAEGQAGGNEGLGGASGGSGAGSGGRGGIGGGGGDGGHGGGGGGGSVIGVLLMGLNGILTPDDNTFTLGTAGTGGQAGYPEGVGIDGVQAEFFEEFYAPGADGQH